MELLLLAESFASVLVLLASIIAILLWALMDIVRSVTLLLGGSERSGRRDASRPANQWDSRHPLFSKRAGQ